MRARETIAVVVTEAGNALNPNHRNYQELKEDLQRAGIETVTIEELQRTAEHLTGNQSRFGQQIKLLGL